MPKQWSWKFVFIYLFLLQQPIKRVSIEINFIFHPKLNLIHVICISLKKYVVTKNIHDNVKIYYKKRKNYESEKVENWMLYVLKYNTFTLEQVEITLSHLTPGKCQ